jgi:hypothetical protein
MSRDVELAAGLLARVAAWGPRWRSLLDTARATGGRLVLIRKAVLVAFGLAAGEAIVKGALFATLAGSGAFYRLASTDPWAAWYVAASCRWGFRMGMPLVLLGTLNFAELTIGVRNRRRRHGKLPPYPEDPTKTQLVLGEIHNQDGSRSDEPEYLILPEGGMFTGLLVVGATGRGKTSSALYPYLRQLIRLHTNEPSKRFAGLVIDPKGNMCEDVRRMCREAGREEDYYEVRMPSVRMNILNRPDLSSPALASHISDVISNVQGRSKTDPFWETAARELATQALRVIRLAEDRPPTMADLYRTSTSVRGYEQALGKAQARVPKMGAEEAGELESIEYWFKNTLKPMDERTRANIAANLSGICSLFDEPKIRRCFCPIPSEETFPGFDGLIRDGRIVVLSLPKAELKNVALTVATMVKLNYQDAVLSRLARADASNANVGRGVFFLADEYDEFVTQADGGFLSKCREARAVNCISIQGYKSLGVKMRDQEAVEQLLAQLTTKIWFGVEDNPTAESAAKLCGKVDREKLSRSVGENAQRAAFSFLDRQSITEGTSSASATTTRDVREQYLFPPWVFTSLERWQTVMKVFDGRRPLPPWVVYTKPIHRPATESWFDQVLAADQEG